MNKHYQNYLKVFLGLFCMALLTYIGPSVLKRVRVDFTEEGLYTLSDGTKSILGKLDTPIKLKLYYSKTAANKGTEGLRIFNNYFSYVKELLAQFSSYSRNNLSIEVIDPRPDTPEEEDALAYGLKKFQLSETEKYFFGLVAENEAGSEKAIEFFDPNEKDKLEYELAKLIYTVLNPQKKRVGVLSSLEVMSEDLGPYMAQMLQMQGKEVPRSWIVIKMLEEFYNVIKIKPEAEAIAGIDILAVVHPKGFSEKMLFAIDQYVMRGGNLIVFADANAVSDVQGMSMGGASASPDGGFKKLMDKWGVDVRPNHFAGDRYLSGIGRYNPNMAASRLLAVVNCDERCSAAYQDTVTSGVRTSTFIFPGAVEVKKIEGVTVNTLMATTAKGNIYEAHPQEMQNPQIIWQKFVEGDRPVPLAVKLVGEFSTAFPHGPQNSVDQKKDEKKVKEKVEVVLSSQKKSAIVVFSDVDFLSDQFAFKNSFLGPSAANGNSALFLNGFEALAGDVDLLSVRSKGAIARNFDIIDQIEFSAEAKTENKVKEINASIARFQGELNQLGKSANEGNLAVLQNEGIRKKKELLKKVATLKRELRTVKREGREKVEDIGRFFQYLNTLFVPLMVIFFGSWYFRKRNRLMTRAQSEQGNHSSYTTAKKEISQEAF